MTSIKQTLDTMLNRCLALHGYDLKEVDGKLVQVGKDEAVREFMKTLAADTTSSKEMSETIIAAWDDKSGKLQRELDSVRVEQISNFIVSESTFKAGFFKTETLGPDEQPAYTNETKNEMRVGVMGDDGTPEQVRVVKPQEKTLVSLYTIASDIVKVKTQDIYRGNVSAEAWATVDIARDLRFSLDRIHFNLLNATTANGGCFGAFSYENGRANKATRIYLAHSGIKTAHLPTTNDVVQGSDQTARYTVRYYDPVETNGALTGFRPGVLLAAMDYCDCWGSAVPTGGRMTPTGEIIVPASDLINIVRSNLIKSGTVESAIQKEVQENGYASLMVAGRNWKFIPDVTIDAGTCFVRTNQLPGISYEKPSWNKAYSKMDDIENWETRWQKAAYGLVIPSQYRVRALRIKYIA